MKNLEDIYIIGASGFAKEVYNLIVTEKLYKVAGFIDSEPKEPFLEINNAKVPIVKEEQFLRGNEGNHNIAIGIGNPKTIEIVSRKFSNFKFPNVISNNVILGPGVKMGKGNIITQGVIFTTDIRIGSYNIFNLACTIGHDTKIGDFNVINPSVNISGGVEIGNNNLLGVGAVILQYKSIGNANIIGGSSLVTKDISNEKLVVGIPGKEKEL